MPASKNLHTTGRCPAAGFLNIDWGPGFADSNP